MIWSIEHSPPKYSQYLVVAFRWTCNQNHQICGDGRTNHSALSVAYQNFDVYICFAKGKKNCEQVSQNKWNWRFCFLFISLYLLWNHMWMRNVSSNVNRGVINSITDCATRQWEWYDNSMPKRVIAISNCTAENLRFKIFPWHSLILQILCAIRRCTKRIRTDKNECECVKRNYEHSNVLFTSMKKKKKCHASHCASHVIMSSCMLRTAENYHSGYEWVFVSVAFVVIFCRLLSLFLPSI